jgi:hypothetical protein
LGPALALTALSAPYSEAASHRLMHLNDIAFWIMKKDLMPFFRESRPII